MLTIGAKPYAAMAEGGFERFVSQVKGAIRSSLPTETAHMSEAELDQRVRGAIGECQEQGIKSPAATSQYAALSCVYGQSLPDQPGFSLARSEFEDRRLPDEARVHALKEAAPDQRMKLPGGTGLFDWDGLQTKFRLIWPLDQPEVWQPKFVCPDKLKSACCVRQLLVRCQHDRSFYLKLPAADGLKPQFLELVTESSGADKVSFELNGSPCAKGLAEPWLMVTGPDLKARDKKKLELDLMAPGWQKIKFDPQKLWNLLLVRQTAASHYQVGITACEVPKAMQADLYVFPKYKISAALAVGGGRATSLMPAPSAPDSRRSRPRSRG